VWSCETDTAPLTVRSGLATIDYLGISASWMDPGVFALIGAASFFAGVSRLTIALAVIVTELSNDIHFLLPIMLAVMIAKSIADTATHSLYHALLEVRCVPFLENDPVVRGTCSFQGSSTISCLQWCLSLSLTFPVILLNQKVWIPSRRRT
jgi:hypothetical protein